MGMALDDIRLLRPETELGPPDWFEYLRILGVPPGLLSGVDHAAFRVLVARLDGENVATAMAFELGSDCDMTRRDSERATNAQLPLAVHARRAGPDGRLTPAAVWRSDSARPRSRP